MGIKDLRKFNLKDQQKLCDNKQKIFKIIVNLHKKVMVASKLKTNNQEYKRNHVCHCKLEKL